MKKGFTLIELVAVIAVIAIILLIAVPKVINTIVTTKINSLEGTIKMISSSAEKEYVTREVLGTLDQTNDPITCEDVVKIEPSIYSNCNLIFEDGIASIELTGDNDYEGYFCSGNKDISNCELIDSNDFYNEIKGVNAPQLANGMTPVIWNGTTWEETTESDSNWYDYTTKKWANAKTEDGSMWVWIPRYIYKIASNWHSSTAGSISIQFTKNTDDNWNSDVIGNITSSTEAIASNNTWTNHPGFSFGDKELLGMWVAKFEATAVEGLSNNTLGDNVTTKKIKISPNVQSWRYINVSNAFIVSRNMETSDIYGWGTSGSGIDTHLIKNTEWGAIAYLTKSLYGKNNVETWINNSSTYITGCAGTKSDDVSAAGCPYAYTTTNGKQASTTGDVYGVFDMSGGAYEFVSAYINNSSTALTTNASSILNGDSKYKDVYLPGTTDDQNNNYNKMSNKKGDATYETSNGVSTGYGWYSDVVNVPCNTLPLFTRGAHSGSSTIAGLYAFSQSDGSANSSSGFRPILLVQSGL